MFIIQILMFNNDQIYLKKIMDSRTTLKGTVSRDFEGVKMISMDRIVVPDVPAGCLFIFKFSFSYRFLSSKF